MASGIRGPGEFCWINILTPEPSRAREFFGALLGWTFPEIPGMGHRVQVGGSDIGGLFDLNGPNAPAGTLPGIGVMVKVENADAVAEKVKSLGGTAKPAFDIGDQGRMAECYDPTGANFDLWQPGKSPGTEVDTTLHGAPSWFETLTTDTGRAARFYTDLFGWTARATPMGAFDYTVFSMDGADVAGLMPIQPSMGTFPPHWGVYFTVKDCDASAQQAIALGAQLFLAPHDIANVGRFCGIVSPQGVMCYLVTFGG